MNFWPPQPGLTVMQSARSTSSSSKIASGVDGQTATPAVQPSSRICWTT